MQWSIIVVNARDYYLVCSKSPAQSWWRTVSQSLWWRGSPSTSSTWAVVWSAGPVERKPPPIPSGTLSLWWVGGGGGLREHSVHNALARCCRAQFGPIFGYLFKNILVKFVSIDSM